MHFEINLFKKKKDFTVKYKTNFGKYTFFRFTCIVHDVPPT